MTRDLSFCKLLPQNQDTREVDVVHVFNFLRDHVLFGNQFASFMNKCIDVDYQRVHPVSGECSYDADAVNEVWLEAGGFLGYDSEAKERVFAHDHDLDCGGKDFEDAICNLAVLVYEKYGLGTQDTWESVKAKLIETHEVCYR